MAFSEFDFAAASITFCLLIASAAQSTARDVRPSNHGLGYQPQTPSAVEASPPEMTAFFGAASAPPSPSSTLPKASNSTDSSWLLSPGSRERDRIREILLAVALACGLTGGVLLIGSGLFVLYKRRKERRSAPKSTSRPQSLSPPSAAVVDNN